MRRVAAEAGVSQPLLAHHFGSRAGLVDALIRRVVDEHAEAMARGLEGMNKDDDSEALLEYLFGGRFSEFAERDDAVFAELSAEAVRNPEIRTLLAVVYARFQRDLTSHLRKAHPEASAAECRRVAFGLLCLIESNEFFRTICLPGHHHRDAITNGRALIKPLAERLH